MKDTRRQHLPTISPGALIAGAAAVGALGGVVWHARGPAAWERPLIFLLRHEHLPMGRALVMLWQPLPFVVLVLGLAAVAHRSRRPQLALSGTIGCAVAMAVTERVLKPLISRHHMYSGSAMFPSGHVTAAAAFAMFAWLVFDRPSPLRSALALVPILTGWVVISAGMHYPADALAGLLVGGIVVYCVAVGVDRLATDGIERVDGIILDDAVHIELPVDDDRAHVRA